MTVKEKILEKIEKMDEQKLKEFYKIVEEFDSENEPNALAELGKIRISASPDFSVKASLYPYPPETNEK